MTLIRCLAGIIGSGVFALGFLSGCGSEGIALQSGGGSPTSSTTAQGGGGSSSTTGEGAGGAGGAGGSAMVDKDEDGLDDGYEAKIAADYLPFLSVDPADGCAAASGILYVVYPHPADGSLLFVLYNRLYNDDCGIGGHPGDDEAFGVTVDPTKPPPAGIVAIHAIGHQGTLCQQDTQCGQCPGQTACETTMVNGEAWPVVFSSRDKHASYALKDKCVTIAICTDTCTLAPTSKVPPLVNAGSPKGHFTENLTTDGFITAANGWTHMELFNLNPWEPMKNFGGAGSVADDLVDASFLSPACHTK